MKKIFFLISTILLTGFGLSSCLESGLNELPAHEEADITDCYLEYRFLYEREDGGIQMNSIRMVTIEKVIDNETNIIDISFRVPDATDSFKEAERAKVTISGIAMYCYISNAASIEPLEGAPKLGTNGNYSLPVKYKVIAANGKTTKVWTINARME